MTEKAAARSVSGGTDHWKRNLLVFLGGQMVSSLGSMIVSYAVMWHLTLQTRSAAVLTLSVVLSLLPQAIVSIFGGVWADRHSRKRLIIASDSTIAAATLGLALLMADGVDNLGLIYASMAVRSAFAGIQGPAVSAMVPQLVPESALIRVNGAQQSVQSGMMLAAPALAAAIYAAVGIVPVFFIYVVTAAIGVLLLATVPVPRVPRSDQAVGYFGDLAAGARYVGSSGQVRWVMSIVAVVMLLTGASANLTPLMIARSFGDQIWMLSVNELFWSIGMLVGGALMTTLGPRLKHRTRLMMTSAAAIAVLDASLGVSGDFWVFSVLGLLITVGYSTLLVPASTILQEQVAPQLHGRVFGFYGIVVAVSMPLSMLVFGPLANAVSVQAVMILTGAFLAGVLIGISALPAARRTLARRAPASLAECAV